MALRIVTASEPIRVETIVLAIYGPPGVGKSSLGFSAHAPLLLDTDAGAYRSAFRRDSVQATNWDAIAGITKQDVAPYNTVIMDTAGRALDLLSADIIANDPKRGRGGALDLQGYGILKTRFAAYLKHVRSFGLDVVLIAHSDEKQQGDEIIERLDMQGASKQEVYKSADSMARLGIVGGKRVLNFSPTETRFGKDPAGLGAVEIPHLSSSPHFLGELIDRIKLSLNAQSTSAKATADKFTEWTDRCRAASTPAELTALIVETRGDKKLKNLLNIEATSRGLVFDAVASGFVPANGSAPKAAPAAQPPVSQTPPREQTASKPTEEPKPITDRQMKRFWALAKGAGYTDAAVKRMLSERFKLGGASELTRDTYEAACEAAEDPEAAEHYNLDDPAQTNAFVGVGAGPNTDDDLPF